MKKDVIVKNRKSVGSQIVSVIVCPVPCHVDMGSIDEQTENNFRSITRGTYALIIDTRRRAEDDSVARSQHFRSKCRAN